MDLFISTSPFGVSDPTILEPLKQSGFSWSSNNSGRKLKPEELLEAAKNCKALVAGTENLLPLIEINPDLKMIARVGIGLDGVPLHECRKRGIRVSWTPDAVTRAVAELTVGQMLSSSRFVRMLDAGIRKQQWSRPAGRGIHESIIGLIGFGRIGSSVARLLGSFSPEQILVRDIVDKTSEIHALQQEGLNIRSAGLEEILKSSHIISLHVPLWKETRHMIGVHELEMMRQDAMLINTARGGI
ncbi:MAG: NAD(P)-dependent oxidoreductase, partial [SAR324 cluster bacterium]|nr:NAD(P)-dependent oxidoreductase [SAR324 cluster bacterium]